MHVYFFDTGQLRYEKSRKESANTLKIGAIEPFINWVEERVKTDKWSLDTAVGYARYNQLFPKDEMACTKTMYNYLHQGVLSVTALDLPMIVRHSTRKQRQERTKRNWVNPLIYGIKRCHKRRLWSLGDKRRSRHKKQG